MRGTGLRRVGADTGEIGGSSGLGEAVGMVEVVQKDAHDLDGRSHLGLEMRAEGVAMTVLFLREERLSPTIGWTRPMRSRATKDALFPSRFHHGRAPLREWRSTRVAAAHGTMACVYHVCFPGEGHGGMSWWGSRQLFLAGNPHTLFATSVIHR